MSTLSPERWKRASPYLDQALAMTEEERAAWLATLRQEDPSLAADLSTLLAEHQELLGKGFLEAGPSAFPLVPATAGDTLGAYTLLSPLGTGGMGTVWLAERADGRFERQVAVKLPALALMDAAGRGRFEREGKVLGRLAHPHIAALVDAGVSSTGQPYLVLERVDGEPIDRYCDARKLPVENRLSLFLDVLAAVAHAHANLIVHRDLKPSNVLVGTDGQVKLLDFGIAKLLEGDGSDRGTSQPTRAGTGAMTPEYAAPEQVTGGTVTTATDVYALGLLLYLLLTGRHPHESDRDSPVHLLKAIVETEPPRVSEVVRDGKAEAGASSERAARRAVTPEKLQRALSGDLDTIVAKALRKDPRQRYATVIAFADDLRRHLSHQPISARPAIVAHRAARFVRRNRLAVGLGSLALAAAAGGVIGTLVQARTARAQRDFAFVQVARAEAINDLNAFLLSDAAPSGKAFTVTDLLGRAEHILERQHGEDANRVELLISVGRQYWSLDEDEKSSKVLDQAYRLSRHLTEPSVRGKAACALASALGRGSELPRAEALIQEGLRELPDEPQFSLDRIFCLLRGSEVSRLAGRAQEGVERSLSAQEVMRRSPFSSELLEVRVLMDLAESYREASRQREAVSMFEQASEKLALLGRDETETAGTLFNNWALTLDFIGRPLEAERIFRRAIDISRGAQGEAISPMLLTNYARTLYRLDRLDQSADYAERAYSEAVRTHGDVVINQSLLLRAYIYRKQGDLSRSEKMLEEVEPRLRKALPPGHLAFSGLVAQHSQQAQARGDLTEALALANQALAMTEAAVEAGGGASYIPSDLIRRADIEIELHKSEQAVADARRALDLLKPTIEPGSFSSALGKVYLTLGRALQAAGSLPEARQNFELAAGHLRKSLGPDHPDSIKAESLAKLPSEPTH
jgi:eukaryotic-like serine/threonine-protein kinase